MSKSKKRHIRLYDALDNGFKSVFDLRKEKAIADADFYVYSGVVLLSGNGEWFMQTIKMYHKHDRMTSSLWSDMLNIPESTVKKSFPKLRKVGLMHKTDTKKGIRQFRLLNSMPDWSYNDEINYKVFKGGYHGISLKSFEKAWNGDISYIDYYIYCQLMRISDNSPNNDKRKKYVHASVTPAYGIKTWSELMGVSINTINKSFENLQSEGLMVKLPAQQKGVIPLKYIRFLNPVPTETYPDYIKKVMRDFRCDIDEIKDVVADESDIPKEQFDKESKPIGYYYGQIYSEESDDKIDDKN